MRLNIVWIGVIVVLGRTQSAGAACPVGQVEAFAGSDTCILDPLAIPKYETPLVFPPVMNSNGIAERYDIAVRQFEQQILPGGIWNDLGLTEATFPATRVWSYGPAADPTPAVAPDSSSQFNYPAYTIETTAGVPVGVRWINDLVVAPDECAVAADPSTDPACNFLTHILPVDQTLHWANPPMDCRDGTTRTDCSGQDDNPYLGPVPIVTHVHGAHVDGHSDGYPEAWWLPAANDIPGGWATNGALFDDATGANPGSLGYADYFYRQDQPATTLWYHDHSLGMTRLNVYAGPAGFWLIRGGKYDKIKDTRSNLLAVLPGPAPAAGQTVLQLNNPDDPVRQSIREIPVVIQDRSFAGDGSTLFYSDNRAFFEGLNPAGGTPPTLDIPFVDLDPTTLESDIAPIWLPEAFFGVMVVNGVAWPNLDVAPAGYRLRLLNGCNSRFLNLALYVVDPATGDVDLTRELPFYQIGAEQGFLPNVAMISAGFATPLPGDGTIPVLQPQAGPGSALLMGLAERADVIVDFSGLPDGTVVRMINTAPDAPFGGFPDTPADPATTGQVMEFTVKAALFGTNPNDGLTSSPFDMKPKAEKSLRRVDTIRQVSLNEGESERICVDLLPDGSVTQAFDNLTGLPLVPPGCIDSLDPARGAAPFGPKEALLGAVDLTGAAPAGIPLKWTDTTGTSKAVPVQLQDGTTLTVNVTENPTVGAAEIWEIYNFTADGHPIHLHLVRFEVVNREVFDAAAGVPGAVRPPEAWESGFKDTVIAYPGEITRVRAEFDLPGLYVWHCHIVEHEDNEMMRPYVVSP